MEGEIELTTAGVSPLVGVLTLGVYRERPEADAGRNVRGLSDVGWLIHQAKYIRSDRASLTQDDALVRLAEALCEQIASHEIFAAATFIVGAPSTGGEGFSDQLTSYVSDLSEIQHAIARDLMPGAARERSPRRPAAIRLSEIWADTMPSSLTMSTARESP